MYVIIWATTINGSATRTCTWTAKNRPFIDTTSNPYYNVSKVLLSLVQPLTHNDYNLKDFFRCY